MLQPSLSYNLLKFSLQMWRLPPGELEGPQYEAVHSRAEAECLLQEKILASKEAKKIVVPTESIEEAMAALSGRYASPLAFAEDLAANDMDLGSMAAALEVDLAVEATMAQVAAEVAGPSEAQVAKSFAATEKEKPEQRRLRHILITINDQFPENRRQAALARITKVRDKALAPGVDFGELAQRYSECPSALQGGSVGSVGRSGIYPSMAETLFALDEGEISEVVESNMGFHVLLCEEVIKSQELDPAEVKARISKSLHAQSRKQAVRAWLASL